MCRLARLIVRDNVGAISPCGLVRDGINCLCDRNYEFVFVHVLACKVKFLLLSDFWIPSNSCKYDSGCISDFYSIQILFCPDSPESLCGGK